MRTTLGEIGGVVRSTILYCISFFIIHTSFEPHLLFFSYDLNTCPFSSLDYQKFVIFYHPTSTIIKITIIRFLS